MSGKIVSFSFIRRPDGVDAMLAEIRAKARQLEARSARVLQTAREGSTARPKDCPQCGKSTLHCRLKNGLSICGLCGMEH